MPKRKKSTEKRKVAPPMPTPPIDVLLATQAARDPRAWEAMLTLNKMRSAQRRQARAADGPQDGTKRRD